MPAYMAEWSKQHRESSKGLNAVSQSLKGACNAPYIIDNIRRMTLKEQGGSYRPAL